MTFEEKRAWIMLVTSVGAYAVYLVVVLGRLGDGPADEIPYVAPLLWSIGGAIVAAIVLGAFAGMFSGESPQADARDREIGRFGEYVGQSFVVIGGVAALLMAILELDYFWIANTVYLCFVLSSLLGSIAKIFAYRRGFHPW